MSKYTYISRLLILFTLMLVGCEGIFVPDPINPQLPGYTEKGNNVAGAFINEETWKSIVSYGWGLSSIIASNKPFITSYINKDSLLISFNGELSGDNVFVEFHIKGMNVRKFDDLINFKNKKIQLDGIMASGVCMRYTVTGFLTYHGTGGIGQLYVKNVVLQNDSQKSATLSGTFGFICYDILNKAYEISFGRFDYNLTESSNFEIKIEM